MENITFIWKVESLSTVQTETVEDFVVNCLFSLTATCSSFEQGTVNPQITDAVTFVFDSSQESFIPYNELTEEIVIGWIKDKLGVNTVENYENTLADQVNNLLDPPVTPEAKALPW